MRYLTLIPLLFLFLATPLAAVEYQGIYQSEVEVPDQGAEARIEGMRQAMGNVLLKVTGTGAVQQSEGLLKAMQSASRYVQQYRYRNESIPEEERRPGEDGQVAEERLMLSVRFDRNSVDELLRNHGFTVWGAARPSTLIWFGVEQGNRRQLVGANDSGQVKELLREEAERRALPIKLPLLDLTDQSRVEPVDVWGDFVDTLEQASERYTHQALLLGRLYRVSSRQWEARWTLKYRGELTRWQQQADEVSVLIEAGIGRTAEELVKRFTSSIVSGSDTMLLEVEGIGNLRQYRRVLEYLAALHGVSHVMPAKVTPDRVRFTLQTEGGSEALLQVIALGDALERVESPPPAPQFYRSAPGAETSAPGATPTPGAPVVTPAVQPVTVYRLVP